MSFRFQKTDIICPECGGPFYKFGCVDMEVYDLNYVYNGPLNIREVIDLYERLPPACPDCLLYPRRGFKNLYQDFDRYEPKEEESPDKFKWMANQYFKDMKYFVKHDKIRKILE